MQQRFIKKTKAPLGCVLVFILLFAADYASKLAAISQLSGGRTKTVIKNILSFQYLENTGAAWGTFSGKTTALAVFTFVVMLFIIYFLRNTFLLEKHGTKKWLSCALRFDFILILAGAAGNLADRIFRGYVVDFISTDFMDFPVFNVADCYVTIGSILLIILSFALNDEAAIDLILKGKRSKTCLGKEDAR